MSETPDQPEFHLGLTMSGAISAGAYTAGVFDFLIQALDEWEKARRGEIAGVAPASVPNHRVGVKVMSGASAGAITAGVGAIALADAGQAPVFFDPEAKTRIKCYLPKLYETWVVKPALVSDSVPPNDFLTATDLYGPALSDDDDFSRTTRIERPPKGAPRPVTSLLNSRLLDEIAKAAVDVASVGAPRAYVAEKLHVYLTLTNLRGVPYKVFFEGGDYHMMSHGDRVHYAATGLGAWRTDSPFSDADLAREVDAAWLENGHLQKQVWKDFTVCALASAAFPVGLAPRQVYAATAEYAGERQGETAFRRFPDDTLAGRGNIEPPWPVGLSDYPFMSADGGTIDNDPFEYARFALKREGNLGGANDPRPEAADRAVIMISPFPTGKAIQAADKPAWDIYSIVAALAPALIDQARFKPDELVLAADPDYASRYLISPRRVGDDGKVSPYPIASGLLGGFGGFVSRSFRDHDFQLGRRNCQRFLQEAFALPADNPCIEAWAPEAPKEQYKAVRTDAEVKANAPEAYCLIPLFGTASKEVRLPDWPRISIAAFDALQPRIAGRFDAVATTFLTQTVTGPLNVLLRPLLWRRPSWIGLIRAKALTFVKASILADLVHRNQIEGFADLPNQASVSADDVRLVLAALIAPDFSPRSASDVAKALGKEKESALSPSQIATVLEELTAAKGKAYQVWKAPWTNDNGESLYALASHKPPLPQQIFPWLRGAIRQLRRNPSS